MSDIQVRGYMISSTVGFIRDRAGEQTATRLLSGLSPGTNKALGAVKSAEWYPVSIIAELNRAIATELAAGDRERARVALADCGKFMAREATNTFLKLLMKMLTPSLFAKKLPDFWKRDCTGGRLVVDVEEQRLRCRFFDAKGYDHLGAVATGYAWFVLEAMGKTVENAVLNDWSPSEPNVDGVSFEIFWKK
jgi:hypothetical protein